MREHSGRLGAALMASALVVVIVVTCVSCAPEGATADAPKAGTPAVAAPAPTATPARRGSSRQPKAASPAPLDLQIVDLSNAVNPIPTNPPVKLTAAKNEWTSFVLQVGPRVPGATYALR